MHGHVGNALITLCASFSLMNVAEMQTDGTSGFITEAKDSRAHLDKTTVRNIHFLRDTPLVIQNGKSGSHRASYNPPPRTSFFSSTYYFIYLPIISIASQRSALRFDIARRQYPRELHRIRLLSRGHD